MKLQLTNWEVKGFWPGEPLWTKSVESTVQRRGVTPWVKATVPGGVHKALENAGLIADPDFGMNSLLCEWVEHRWWVYRTFFDTPDHQGRMFLRFDGVDDECRILLNGTEIAAHQGIYEPILCDVTGLVRRGEPNQLLVILMEPPREQGQIGWTSKTFTQKARFGYKWDFCTHLVNIGLWRGVYLLCTGSARIDHICVTSDVQSGTGLVHVQAKILGECKAATVKLSRNGQLLQEHALTFDSPWDPQLDLTLTVENPELWWPNGMGEQPLYDVEILLDNASDVWTGRIGIRSLTYTRCDGADKHALAYVPVINGEKVYIRGVNMTPLNHRYGDVTREDYQRMFGKMVHMHVNTVRVWGGGLIETEEFYELADACGILVWQEFIQSSSGIDNIPSHDRAFLKLLEDNSRAAILEKRNHVSLTWWSGGNELADARFRPITTGDENIFMLYKLVQQLDPQRLFLPSSPSGPSFGLDTDDGHHDVHGNWQYDGVEGHYTKYNLSDSMLQSEFGADGMASVSQLKKVLPEEDYGVYTMKEHVTLRHHGEWWETLLKRDIPLFGDIASLTCPMESWVGVSQLIQAEAIRYIVASNRRRRGQNCGSIIWQVNEPFPNVSCTNLVEYYGHPKMAYYAVRRAYANAMLGMKYDSLIQPAGKEMQVEAYLDVQSVAVQRASLTLQVMTLRGEILREKMAELTFAEGKTSMADAFTLPALDVPVFMVRLTAELDNGEVLREEYFFSQQEEAPLRALLMQGKPDVKITRQGNTLTLSNISDKPALCLFGLAEDAPHAVLSDNNLVLMPGEARMLHIFSEDAPASWVFTDLAGHTFSIE